MFGDSDTLVIYFWMYGPERERAVPDVHVPSSAPWTFPPGTSCKRVPIAIVGRSPIERQLAFKRERGLAQPRVLCDDE